MFFRKFTIYSSVMLSVFTMSIVGSFAAQAATFTVSSYDDKNGDGVCDAEAPGSLDVPTDNPSLPNGGSLRYAILDQACATDGDDIVSFDNRRCGDPNKAICLSAPIVIPASCKGKIRIENDASCDPTLAIRPAGDFDGTGPLIRIERAGTIINGMNFIKAKGDALQIAADDVQVRHSNFGVREESNTATAYPNAGAGVRLVSKSSGAGPENAYIATSTFRANKGGAIVIEAGKNHALYFNNFFGNGGQDINLVKAGESAGAVTPAEGVTGAATDPNELVKYPYDVVAKMEACTQGSNDLACVRLTGTFDGVLSGETANLLIQHTPKTSSDVSAGFYHAMVSINSANFDVLIPAAPQALTLDSAPTIVTGDTLRVVGMAASGNTSELSAKIIVDDPNACKLKDFYIDNDGDSYGQTTDKPERGCTAPEDENTYVEIDGDCNDDDPEIHPGAIEICDYKDNNCDGERDEGMPKASFYLDRDHDELGGNLFREYCVGTNGDPIDVNGLPIEEGWSRNSTDCNDSDATVGGPQSYYLDEDSDLYGSTDVVTACIRPIQSSTVSTDCAPSDSAINPGATEICNNGIDENCNGAADDTTGACALPDTDADDDGSPDDVDCDDANNTVYPGALELCDGLDNDCNGAIDDNDLCHDADGDTFTDNNPVPGLVDCDDTNSTVNPGATEICNTIDDDCDGVTDEGVCAGPANDIDGDTFTTDNPTPALVDCNDRNEAVHPGATEICNAIDDDCDGIIDEGACAGANNDLDGDTFTTDNPTPALVDCNDRNNTIHPGATEICNGVDDDCDGTADDGLTCNDADQDGFPTPADCNDANSTVHPGATEICNLIDDNCDGQTDEGNVCLGDNDVDDDGHDTIPSGGDDCNDRNEAVNPDEAENCTNGIDDDCNGKIDGQDDACKDEDNDDDGQTPAGGDCNDANATIFTGAVDIPDDGIDQDCNGIDATIGEPIGGGTGRFNGGAGCSLVME